MKKLHLILIFFISVIFVVNAQDDQNDERQKFMFDSVMNLMRDKSIPFIERNNMTKGIEHLLRDNQVEVLKELLPEARDYEDKTVITRLYSLIGLFSAQITQYAEAKLFLDSALIYADKIDDHVMKGLAYYCMGIFYSYQNKMSDAHVYYYKAAEYYKKENSQHPILHDIYYDLSIIYNQRKDWESLKELIEWMEEISVAPVQRILQYSTQACYFRGMYDRTGELRYLDSVLDYNRKSFDLYLADEHPYDVAYQIANNYFMQAEAYYYLNQYDSSKVYLDKAIELDDPNNYYGEVQYCLLNCRLLFYEGRFDEAETGLNEGLQKLKDLQAQDDINLYEILSDYYTLFSQVQEKKGKMKDALDSERESQRYAILHYDAENKEYVQDLRAKYDLDNKQRSINQLTEINKMYERNRVLYIGIGILLVIIIVLIIFLSRRKYKITQVRLKEAELISQLEREKNKTLTAKINENEQHYKLILSENKLEQVNSYLEGLEFERLRLSKELHDNIANNILLVNLRFQDQEQIDVSEISQQLKAIHEQVRNISHELIPPVFEYASFVEILRDYVCQQNSHDKIAISLSIDPEEEINKISEKICLEFYRIVQECISNAFKHSMASNIEVLLYKEEECLNLTIIDDGKGFDTKSTKSGIGLIIVNERVKSLNGSININSTIGKGTEFNITAPL